MNTAQVLHNALQLANATSIEALVGLYRTAIHHFGFSHFIVTGLPGHGQRFENLVLERFWPEDWMSHYVSRDYIKRDPVAIASNRRTVAAGYLFFFVMTAVLAGPAT